MSDSILSAPYFHDEQAAYSFVEARLWSEGKQVCPHCGVIGEHYELKGKSTRVGVRKCRDCRKPFTVKVGTIFESSHIALRLWLQAIFLIASSKKGISSNQLHRTLGITLKSAWFMSHRIREAMGDDGAILGGGGEIVEADETYFGEIKGAKRAVKGGGGAHKHKIVSLVQRTGATRSFHVANVDHNNLKPILTKHIAKDSHLMTDGAQHYKKIGAEFDTHESTNHHQKEYAKPSKIEGRTVHSNTVESYFSLLKRGLVGTFHHVSEAHLQRYVTEFDFRFSHRETKEKIDGKWVRTGPNDGERAERLLKGVKGKRLTYKTTVQ